MTEFMINMHDTSLVMLFVSYLAITSLNKEIDSDWVKFLFLCVFFISGVFSFVGAILRIWA